MLVVYTRNLLDILRKKVYTFIVAMPTIKSDKRSDPSATFFL